MAVAMEPLLRGFILAAVCAVLFPMFDLRFLLGAFVGALSTLIACWWHWDTAMLENGTRHMGAHSGEAKERGGQGPAGALGASAIARGGAGASGPPPRLPGVGAPPPPVRGDADPGEAPSGGGGAVATAGALSQKLCQGRPQRRRQDVGCFDLLAFRRLLTSRSAGEDTAARSSPAAAAPGQGERPDAAKHVAAERAESSTSRQSRPQRHDSAHSVLNHHARKLKAQDGAAWLDAWFGDIWPRLSKYIETLFRQSVEPAINAQLPDFLKGNARFEEVSLGTTPPVWGPIEVFATEDGSEIELRFGLRMHTDSSIQLAAVGLNVGISKIKLEGELALVFRPYMERPPFFGGLEIYFVNPPSLDLAFQGAGRIADFPIVRPVVRSTLSDLIAGKMVLPNRIAKDFNQDDDVDIADLRKPDPQLVLRLTVRGARDLPASDIGVMESSSDPYVVVMLGATRRTSRVIKQNLNPVWDFTADYPVHDPDQTLSFLVYDEDNYSPDDLIATARTVKLGDILADMAHGGAPSDIELPLRCSEGEQGAGTLQLSGRFLRLGHSAPGGLGLPGLYVAAKIREVRGLAFEPGSARHPFKVQVVCASVEGSSKGSSASAVTELGPQAKVACAKLLRHGTSRLDVAEFLGVDEHSVIAAMRAMGETDEDLEKALKACEFRRQSTSPMFDEVVQLLIPDARAATRDGCELELRLVDKKGDVVADTKVDMHRLLAAPDEWLDGPFPMGAAELHGSLRVCFYSGV